MKSSDVFAQVQLAQSFATEELKRKLAPVGKFVADEMISKRVFTITFAGDKFPGIYTRDIVDYLRTLGYEIRTESHRNESYITVTAKP
ncbi:putative phage protein [Aeromonas phage Aes508]|uniref:Putative phage protein n=1 Tax=Aeromonas phage Aes508 TaxID=1198013 RepID=J7KD08_9CAUD|nr:hypothetical protein F484_gp087 [Aeromonas phage Aes508]AFQ97170.1 putative phage protein [Aeromonas phage Aes508]